MVVLKPKIDTLPLSLASRDAETEKEQALCIMDLASQIIEGKPYPKELYLSTSARTVLSQRAFKELGVVLRSARNYELEKKFPRKFPTSNVQESCAKKPCQLKKMTTSISHDVKKGKGKALGRVSSRSTGPKPLVVVGLMCHVVYTKTCKVKGKVHLAFSGDVVSRKINVDKNKVKEKGKGEEKVVPDVVVQDGDDGGYSKYPVGWFADRDDGPKYDLYLEDSDDEGGWKKYKVYEEIDLGEDNGPNIPMSPCFTEE